MALQIIKGTTKDFLVTIDKLCGRDSKTWNDFDKAYIRIMQHGGATLTKELVPITDDKRTAKASFTQDDTIKLKQNEKFMLQILALVGSGDDEVASKSEVYLGDVLPSLWDEVVHNG